MDNKNQYTTLITKYLSGETSSDEQQLLFDWINEDKQNEKQYNETKKAWNLSLENIDTEVATINLDDEWSKIESVLGFEKKTKLINIETHTKKKSFSWARIAAVITIFIIIGGSLFYLSYEKKTELVATNSVQENKLPDGSKIALKYYSSISYTKEYNQKQRRVSLNGEAFFEVQADKSKPFIVEAGKLYIEVLGTSFLVKNLEKKNYAEVFVNSGKVLVYSHDNKSDSVVLTAGDKVVFDSKTLKITKSKNLDQNYMAWKTKLLNFDKVSLGNVVNTLNHTYNSNIVIKNKSLKKCTVTVKFENQNLESVLKVLKATLDIKISKKGKKIEISGNGCENEPKE